MSLSLGEDGTKEIADFLGCRLSSIAKTLKRSAAKTEFKTPCSAGFALFREENHYPKTAGGMYCTGRGSKSKSSS